MRITQLWRYPVKSLRGEQVPEAELGPRGIAGDRGWVILDVATGFGLTARREPRLLAAAAAVDAAGLRITLPDGTTVREDDAADAHLSDWLGRPVALRSPGQVARPRYENPSDTEAEAPASWAPFEGASGRFHDGVAVTLLGDRTAGDRALARFRANVVLDGDGEDAFVGRTVALGGTAQVQVESGVPRCVMVTRAQPGGVDTDREVLRWIHRERGGELSVGGAVQQPGTVRVGDEARAL